MNLIKNCPAGLGEVITVFRASFLSSTMNLINSDCPGAKSVTLVAWYSSVAYCDRRPGNEANMQSGVGAVAALAAARYR